MQKEVLPSHTTHYQPLLFCLVRNVQSKILKGGGGEGGEGSEKNECLRGIRVPAMDICLRVLLCFLSKEEF